MARLCLPKYERENIAKALKSGEIKLIDLYAMDDAARNLAFQEYVGKDLAQLVNAKFEQAMLSNQKAALSNWVKSVTTAKEPIRRDLLKKVDRIQKVLKPDERAGFLKDLAEDKLGISVTEKEAATITALKEQVDKTKEAIPAEFYQRSDFVEASKMPDEALRYGFALDDFQQYVQGLKTKAIGLSFKERVQNPIKYLGRNITDALGVARSLLSSWDLGLSGRQAWPLLLRGNAVQWGKNVADSFKVFGNSLMKGKAATLFAERDDAALKAIRAHILAQPNSLNGKFLASKNKYGLDVLGVSGEEAFPTDFPERIPLFGRVYKASQDAYNGGALMLRARLASQQIDYFEKMGVDMLTETNATAVGSFVSSLTGRGPLTRFAASADTINKMFFAPKYMKGLFNTVTAHQFDPVMRVATPEITMVRRKAALSSLRIAANLTALLTFAKMMGFEVEADPRSTKFGKICTGSVCINVTGGLNGFITLGSRFVLPFHQGELAIWSKSPTTGKYTKLTDAEFGQQNGVDMLTNFFAGKLAPGPGVVRDWLKGVTFKGTKPTVVDSLIGLVTPISGQTLYEEMQKGNDDLLIIMLAETFGFSPSSNTIYPYGTRWNELREKEGDEVFHEATLTVTDRYKKRADKLRGSTRWKKMDNDERSKELDKIRKEETDRVLNRYGI